MKNRLSLLFTLSSLALISCGGQTSSVASSSSVISSESGVSESISSESSSESSIIDPLEAYKEIEKLLCQNVLVLTDYELNGRPGSVSYYTDNNVDTIFLLEDEQILSYETYSFDEKGFVYTERLNMGNKQTLRKVINGMTGDYFKWEQGYENPFLFIDADQATLKGTKLKFALDQAGSDAFSTALYGNPGIELDEVTLDLADLSEIKISAESSSKDYDAIFEGSIAYGEMIHEEGFEMFTIRRGEPYPERADARFDKLINALHGGNYTLDQYSMIDGATYVNAVYKSTKNGFYYNVTEDGELYNDGAIYKQEENKIYCFRRQDTEFKVYKKITCASQEEFEEYAAKPRIHLSASCFAPIGTDQWMLLPNIEADADQLSGFYHANDDLQPLMMEIYNEKYIHFSCDFTNSKGREFADDFYFSDVGTTKLPDVDLTK